MKHILWSAATAALLFASCAKDDAEVVNLPASDDFTATLAAESRTVLDGTSVLWEADDLLTIFTKTNHNRQYKVKSLDSDQRTATFGYVSYTSPASVETISSNYALYPYDAEATLAGDVITTTLATEQVYDAQKVDLANSLMVAKSSDNALSFKNAGALVRFKLSKEDLPDTYTLQSIKLVSAANKIAGEVAIDTGAECKAVVTENGVNTVALTEINTEITTTQQLFYIALPATVFEAEDLTVTFVYTEGEKSIKLPAFTLSQNSIKSIAYQIKAEDFEGTTGEMSEVWDGETTTEPTLNSEGYYEIGTAAELAWFAGKYHANMVLTADIDMGNNPMKNIITYNKELLGNGHTIKNLKVIPAGSEGWAALFSNSGNGCGVTVKNLTLDNIQVEGKEYSAVVLGYAQGTVILDNVKVLNSTVKATNKVGALVGFAENSGEVTISECLVQGTTVSTNVTGGEGQIGAVVGYVASKTTITNTKAIGNTVESHFSESSKAFGKFVGMYAANDPKVLTLTNCTEQGTTLAGLDDTARAYAADYDNQSLHNLVGARRSGYNGTITVDGMVLVAPTNDAVKAAWQQGGTIALPAGTFDINVAPTAGAVIKGAGKDKTIINLTDGEYTVSGSVAFEDLTIKKGNANYTGFAHTTTASYKNCKIEGVLFLYGGQETFTSCEFVQTADAYNVWTYGASNVSFNNCSFYGAKGKSLLLFQDGSSVNAKVDVIGCTFKSDEAGTTWDGKAVTAMDIDSSQGTGTYQLNISQTTVEGYNEGVVSGNNIWNHKAGNNAVTVTLNGQQVYTNVTSSN